jgi:hypothetical protein
MFMDANGAETGKKNHNLQTILATACPGKCFVLWRSHSFRPVCSQDIFQ